MALEETIEELVSVRPAREAFEKVKAYFPSDDDLGRALTRKIGELYPERPVPYNSVISLFRDPRQKNAKKRISDLILDWERQLELFLKGALPVEEELTYETKFLGRKRTEGPAISREIKKLVQPLMDWYQFTSIKSMAKFISDEYSAGERGFSYHLVHDACTGHNYILVSPELLKLLSVMSNMLKRAIQGDHVQIPSKYVTRRRDYSPPEPLGNFISRALNSLLGAEGPRDKSFVEYQVERFKGIKQLSDLVGGIEKAYGFSSRNAVKDFLFEVLDIETNSQHYLRNETAGVKKKASASRKPTNVHRKLYAAAVILDDARKRGVEVRIDPKYLKVGKSYREKIYYIEREGFGGELLEEAVMAALGSSRNAARRYIAGKADSMPKVLYIQLEEFARNGLSDFIVVDLSDERRKSREYERFIAANNRGRVLVKTGDQLSEDDLRMVVGIRDRVANNGYLFLHPTKPKLPKPKDAGKLEPYMPHGLLFRPIDYDKLRQAFIPPN